MNIVVLNYRDSTVDYLKNIPSKLNSDEDVQEFLVNIGYNLDEILYMFSENISTRELSFIDKDKSSTFVCSVCGSKNIQIRGWIDPNTNKYISDCDDDECWCEDCSEETKYVKENEYRGSSI